MVRNVRWQQQRVPSPDDPLLAQPGRAPVHFQRELIGLDDLWRLGEAFAELGEEGDVATGDGAPVV